MSAKVPPPPQSAPLSHEEESARDNDAAAAQISIAWQEALDWAKRGDRRSLAAMLRSEHSLSDEDVRAFLANVLEDKEKRPRGKPARRPQHTFFVDGKGRVSWIDKRDSQFLTIKKWMHDNKKAHRGHSALLEAAARHFKMDPEVLENIVRRSSKSRTKSRST
ncbi:hypothetical protein [Bradyrhizobium glycinis]|uniref:hypothetical protein n=1 Tax=Bradyrhizobium glycinis TaxID=2751812 RepID=UPI0018D5B95D|nr:hypothetical protein [Bradyrhizobium glycinis]MBH5369914.1 hypothetical protein [Bradyrhizobium glycinis]